MDEKASLDYQIESLKVKVDKCKFELY